MDIVTLDFEEVLTFNVNGEVVQIMAFKTAEEGNVKFGVNASRSVKVNREEIYRAMKEKQLLNKKSVLSYSKVIF